MPGQERVFIFGGHFLVEACFGVGGVEEWNDFCGRDGFYSPNHDVDTLLTCYL